MSFLLVQKFPDLAAEFEEMLKKEGRSDLAEQISSLEIVDRCRCADDSCATIYTIDKPTGPTRGNRGVPQPSEKGIIIVHAFDNKITKIQILDRDQIRDKVLQLLP